MDLVRLLLVHKTPWAMVGRAYSFFCAALCIVCAVTIFFITEDVMRVVSVEVTCWAWVVAACSFFHATSSRIFVCASECLDAFLRTMDSFWLLSMGKWLFANHGVARLCLLATCVIITIRTLLASAIDILGELAVDMIGRTCVRMTIVLLRTTENVISCVAIQIFTLDVSGIMARDKAPGAVIRAAYARLGGASMQVRIGAITASTTEVFGIVLKKITLRGHVIGAWYHRIAAQFCVNLTGSTVLHALESFTIKWIPGRFWRPTLCTLMRSAWRPECATCVHVCIQAQLVCAQD